jgi:DnaJ-domain-containing protein 1
MYEQNQQARALVTLTLTEGKPMMASVKLPLSGKLADLLNNQEQFLDVIAGDGEQFFIAKSKVVKVAPSNPPKAGLNMNRRSSDRAQFNPYAVLGVDKTATPEVIRKAYLTQVKAYHPDRFLNHDLPHEMKAYAEAMLTRINIAHDQLMPKEG